MSIGVMFPNASSFAVTKAQLIGDVGTTAIDPAVGTVGIAGAGSIEVKAIGQDSTTASVDSLSIGLLAVSASSADATTKSEVRATIGGGEVTASGDVTVLAQSLADADSYADATSGGLIDIQAGFTAESTSEPKVYALVTGGFVQAGGLLSLTGLHGVAPGTVSDGTILAINCNGADTICFALPHGVQTGANVSYSAPATGIPQIDNGTLPNPNAIGGLGDGRTYGVIKVDDTTIRLGEELDFNDPDTGADVSVEVATGSIFFPQGHNFRTGDKVVYDCNGSGAMGTLPAAGLVCGLSYWIFAIDDNRIRLSTSQLDDDGNVVVSFTTVTSPTEIAVANSAGLDGRAVVYAAPATVDFKNTLIDIDTNGSGQLVTDGNGQIVRDGSWNTIYAPSHGWSTGDAVKYSVTNGPAITGLNDGQTYYVFLGDPDGLFGVSAAGPHMLRLALNPCRAGIGTYNTTPGDGGVGNSCADVIQVISLSTVLNISDPNYFPSILANHSLRRVGYESIGLVEGNMYFIDVVDGTHIRLRDAAGNVVGGLVDKLGTHFLIDQGIAVTSGATGTQRLYIDLNAGGLPPAAPHVLIGVGGPGSQVGPSENGIVSATSTGVGGGLFRFSDVYSEATVKPTVSVEVQGGTLRGKGVLVDGRSYAQVAVSSVGKGGGFLGFGASNAIADLVNTVQTKVADGASIFASGDIQITAFGESRANGEAVNRTGGLIAGADTDVDLEIGYDIDVEVAGDLFANRTILLDAAAAFLGNARASSGSGGLGTNSDANDDDQQGVGVGREHAASVATTLTGTASVRGALVQYSAGSGVRWTVDFAGDTGARVEHNELARGFARSDSDAYALGADSDAGAYVHVNDSVTTTIANGSVSEGEEVRLRAVHKNLDLQAIANSNCGCGGGDTDARAHVTFLGDSLIRGEDESIVRTSELVVSSLTNFDRLYAYAHRSGGLFDVGGSDADVNYQPRRDILWESTVFLLGEPNPVLIVDASGRIIAKSGNVVVRSTQFGAPLGIGDTISGGTIWIDPILYDEKPAALFEANDAGGSCDGDCSGLIHGTAGMFYMQQTWNSVLIRNSSDKAIFIKGTADPDSVSIDVLNADLDVVPSAIISVSVDNGPHAPPATQWFWHLQHIFPATDVVIESLRATKTTGFDITYDGDIRNNLGSTRITNHRGSILRGTDAGDEVITSNRVTLDAEQGSIGTIPNPIALVLVQIFHTGEIAVPAVLKPVFLDAEAGQDLYLDVTTLRRSSLTASTAPIAPVLGPIKAGHDAVVILRDSAEGIDPLAVADIRVDIYDPNDKPAPYGSGSPIESVQTTCYFRPDGPSCAGGVDAPVIVGGTVVLVGLGSDLDPIRTNVTFSDIRAGHSIAIFHPSPATEVTILAYTDGDATWTDDETGAVHGVTDGSGKIDVLTNGNITVVEQTAKGDLRVGHIHSTGLCSGATPKACTTATIAADVTLRSPARILDAELDAGIIDTDDDRTCVDAYDLDCAAGTPTGVDVTGRNITLVAGDNGLGQPGSVSGSGGIGLAGNFLEIQVDAVGGPTGHLDAFDTAADDDKTQGIYIDQVAGHLQIGIVHTAGDDSLATGNVSLRTRSGSILDTLDDAAADVIGQTIDIDAHGGSIGVAANDLEIDSLVGSPFACDNENCADNANGTSDAGLVAIADDVALEASAGIWLTETDAYLRLLFAHATGGDIRITVRESAQLDEDLFLIRNGTANFAEDDSTVPGNNPDHPRVVPNGTIFAEAGGVELRVGDDVTLHPFTQILADRAIDIRGDFGNADTGGTLAVPDPEHGTTMILRGRIIADCVVGAGGTYGYPVGTCTPSTANPVAGRQTNVWGGSDVDVFQLGDRSGLDLAQTSNAALNKEQWGDAGYIFFGAKTIVHGNATLTSTTADGEDEFTVWYLQSMDVVTSPTGLQSGTGAGHTLTLDGQGETDHYAIYTNGSHGNIRNYVINVLDTGLANQGADELHVYGYDNGAAAYNGANGATDDIWLLRALTCIDNESPFALTAGVPATCATPTETADHPAFIALLAGNGNADGGIGLYRDRTPGNEPSALVQRINYDRALNGRITVFGLGGNDAFYVDDTQATMTLDGGAGNDAFQIGQIFGTQRDGEAAPEGGALLPADTFPALVPTTRGWLSPGAHAPLLATGGTGNDRFIVYSNQAEIQLNGDDDNDLFIVRAFAIAAVCDTDADNIAGCGLSDVDYRPAGGVFPQDAADGADDGQCVLAGGYIRYDNNGDDVCNNADAHITYHHAPGSNVDLDNTMWQDDVIPLDANGVAVPVIGLGFSTNRPLDIRAGGGEDEVQYNVNAPVNVDGGTGFDKLVVLGTEFADDFVITDKAIYGAGLNVKYTTIEILEIDGLEGDDQFFVLSTAYGVAYRVIGGLGSDQISVAGDVTADIVTRELEGISGAVDHIVLSDDPRYDGIVVDGVPYNLATPETGVVVIKEHGTSTSVREGTTTGPIRETDYYTVELSHAPTSNIFVTVSAALSPDEEARDTFDNPTGFGLTDGAADTIWLCVDTFPYGDQCNSIGDFQRHYVRNGVVVDEAGRAVVLTFTPGNWNSPQRVYIRAYDDLRSEGDRTVVVQHSVIAADKVADAEFHGAAARQVNVRVYDNDTPGVYVTHVEPSTENPATAPNTPTEIACAADTQDCVLDDRGIVIEGSSTTQRTDEILVQLAKDPGALTITVKITMDADSQRILQILDPVLGSRWTKVTGEAFGTYYLLTFDSTNWNAPVRLTLQARSNPEPGDPTTAIIFWGQEFATSAYKFPNLRSGQQRTDVLVYDDETAQVVTIPTGTDTVVVKCGDAACSVPGLRDGYYIRLTTTPTGDVHVVITPDGLVDVVSINGVAVTPDDYVEIGGDIPSRVFLGNLSFAGSTITRANGSDTGSFWDDGLAIGQRVRFAACTGVYTVQSIAVDGKTFTVSTPLIGCGGAANGTSINVLTRRGIWDGAASLATEVGDDLLTHFRLTRAGGGWLADGLLEGQWVLVCDGDGDCVRAKIQNIRGTNLAHDQQLEFRPDSYDDFSALSGSAFSVVRIAAQATFTAADWYLDQKVELEADLGYYQPIVRQGVKNFPASQHLLTRLRGPLAVEGGVTGADRSLELGLKLPGEQDGPLFAIATQAPESKQIDVLNIYGDGSVAHNWGVMTSTTLRGLGMAKDLDFGAAYGGSQNETFGEPQIFPGGISFGSVSFVDGEYETAAGRSSIEVLNLFLGSGNDRLDIQGTLQPDDPVKLKGQIVLAPAQTYPGFAAPPAGALQLTRPSPFDWKAQGFLIGQPVTISNQPGRVFKVVGFADSDPSDTTDNTVMYLQLVSGGAPTPGTSGSGVNAPTVVAQDVPVTITVPVTVAGGPAGGTVTRATGSWIADGFVVGQLVRIANIAGQWRLVGVTATTLTLDRGDVLPSIAAPTSQNVFVPGPHGGLTAVHGGGNTPIQTVFEMTRTAPTPAQASAFPGAALVLTRLDGLNWAFNGLLPGSGYYAGDPYLHAFQHVQLAGENFTRMILGFLDLPFAQCPYADPFPGCGKGSIMILGGPNIAPTVPVALPLGVGLATDVRVAQPVKIEVTTPVQVRTSSLTRTDGASWKAAGFKVGMQVRISGFAGPFTISKFSGPNDSVVEFANVAWAPSMHLNATGVAIWDAVTLSLTAWDEFRASNGVMIGGDVITVCNRAADSLLFKIAAQPDGLVDDPVRCDATHTAGPGSPLVVYGDTSQDGVWYSGTPGDNLGMEFGPKPFDPFTHIPDGENEDDEWVFGLANPFDHSGNDIIDASGLFADLLPANLPTVGFTAYGGLGDDLIIGSQAGDHLAGGSGDDEIRGLRGVDHIYGDSGVNVDVLTRALDIATINRSPRPTVTGAGFIPNGTTLTPIVGGVIGVVDDLLVAGYDLIYGDGAPGLGLGSFTVNANGQPEWAYDDIVFGDHGAIDQNVADPNEPDPRLQKIQTTALASILRIRSVNLDKGADDIVFGGLGRDVLVGGAGSDMMDGDQSDDILFGDAVWFDRTPGNWTSPRFQSLCGTLLYSRSDITDASNLCNGAPTPTENNSGVLLVDGTPRPYRDPDGAPWWAEYDVTNLFHDVASDRGDKWAATWGNDYLAGGAAHDVLFGQLGDDVLEGDGGIDSAFRRWIDDHPSVVNGVGDAATSASHVGASRTPLGCYDNDPGAGVAILCDYTGVLVVVPSFEAATDGEDYIEGNAGNDVVFGGLGQDDIVGGSSDFFSLDTADKRPDGLQNPALDYLPGHDRGADVIFGGAGSRIGINDQTNGGTMVSTPTTGGTLVDGTLPADMHARDADTIIGDNGRIVRIVGTSHGDVNGLGNTGGVGVPPATGPNYVTFQYDTYGTQKLIVRGVTLLDYTLGGPDFEPENFGLGVGSDCTNGSPTQPICSKVLDTATGQWRNVAYDPTAGAQTGGRDEVHGETGDDTVYTGADHDVVYGDAQDDDIIGGWGNDWISGGTGQDGILGDDGRIFTSRNTSTGILTGGAACSGNATVPGAVNACYSERLYGITALLATDPDTKYSNGNVLNEFIYTPGQGQTATINIGGQLNKAADLTIYNLGPDVNASLHHVANSPLYDANNSDDIIFGGWGSDWIHGGAGDDAISGAEAIGTDPDDNRLAPNGVNGPKQPGSGYAQHFDLAGTLVGLEYIDFAHPWNPGDVLHFGADTNPWHANNHNEMRLGEFLLYDEYDPRRAILFSATGQTWGCTSWSPSGHTCTGSSDRALFPNQFFLNNEDLVGDILVKTCVSVDNQGNCLAWKYDQATDGDDAIFGDLGNDWVVGGTGQDTLWGGWGNDLHQADDDLHSGCLVMANNGTCQQYGDTWLNDIADGVNSSFQDRAYGGAGLDVLIGNTAGDRLIDWVGEFNSYLVPFAPFGMATVSRQNNPALPEFLYALSRSQGADPTRWSDEGSDPARNGEPFGELGLIRQEDHGYWQTQTGGPTDPQAGNIPGGKRDSVRGADFNDGTLQGFLTDSGTFTITQGVLTVTAASSQGDAVAVWYSDAYQTVYYEVSARISMDKPTGGWKANAYIIFDYFGPTDFKFAGIDQSTNKMVIGERTATGWWVRAQGSVPGGVKANTFYNLNVVINGLVVTVTADGKNAFSYTFAPRMIGGQQVALNRGLTGFGSNQAKGLFDNISLTVISPEITIDRTEYFEGGGPSATQAVTGTWATAGGRLQGTTDAAGTATALIGVPVGTGYSSVPQFDATSYVQLTATLRAAGITGILFDWYSAKDYKFVGIDVAGQRVVIGHVAKGVRTIDLTIARALVAGTDYVLDIVLKATVVTVTLGGQVLASYSYNSPLADGRQGLFAFGAGVTASAADYRLRTDEDAYTGSPPAAQAVRISDATVTEGAAGTTKTVTLTVTRDQAGSALSIGWSVDALIANGVMWGVDVTGATSGVVAFAAGATTATITFTVVGDSLKEPDEAFIVTLQPAPGANLADAQGLVTIKTDDG
ncbi:hypothetical protein ACLBXX_18660 [Microbacterium sp. C23T]